MPNTLRLRSGQADPRVDAYIKKAPPFAQPILTHLRKVIHAAVPGVEETIKWSVPAFEYKGPFCSVAAFKQHAAFGFWKWELLKDQLPGSGETANPTNQFDALAKNKQAKATFENFAPGQRREYIAWVTEAKQAATREQRIKTAVAWMAEGKIRNWKYVKK